MRALLVAGVLLAFGAPAAIAQFQDPLGRLPNDYTVTYYGANGTDGASVGADDTTEFLAAIVAWDADGRRGAVRIPQGDFCINRSAVDSLIVKYDGLILRGAGRADWPVFSRGTILSFTANSAQAEKRGVVFGEKPDGSLTKGLTIEDVTFRSTTANRMGTVVSIVNVDGIVFRRCDFYTTRVSGRPGNQAYFGVLVDYTGPAGSGTQNVMFDECGFWAPGPGGGSGISDAVRVRCTTAGGYTRFVRFVNCYILGAEPPGKSLMVVGACSGCGTGDAYSTIAIGCTITGRSGIQYCATSKNLFVGSIVMQVASTDTACFEQYQSFDNMIIGDVNGIVKTEQPSRNESIQVLNVGADAGMRSRGIQFYPGEGTAPAIAPGMVGFYYDSVQQKFSYRRVDGTVKTLSVDP